MKHLSLIIPVLLLALFIAGLALSNSLLPEPETATAPSVTPAQTGDEAPALPAANITDPPNAGDGATTSSQRPPKSVRPTPLTATTLADSYEAHLGTSVSVTGIIGREIRADMSEPSESSLTVLFLTEPGKDVFITLQNNLGEFIECPGVVETCMGFSVGETVTLTGTVIPTATRFLLRLDQ